MVNVLYDDIKNLGLTEGRKKGWKKSHLDVTAPPKKTKHTCASYVIYSPSGQNKKDRRRRRRL